MAPMDNGNNGVEERETFIGHSNPKKSSAFSFIYNKENRTCLGRGAKSWLQIIVFYIIFYACLAAFWLACLAIFMRTLDEKTPRFYGKGSIVGINPGMGYQPWLSGNIDSTLITFNKQDPKSFQKHIDAITTFLAKYDNKTNTRRCGSNEDLKTDETACRFDLDELYDQGCNAENGYGFKDGQPCVLLSLNRLIGWQPITYPEGSEPELIKGRYRPGDVTIDCQGQTYSDLEHIGELAYIPKFGLSGKYFPYKVMNNYHQPIAMVKFKAPPIGRLLLVECKAYAYNIIHDLTNRLGLVRFEILVDDQPVESRRR